MQYDFCTQYCTGSRSHRGRHCACAFYIYTLLMYTNTSVQSNPSSDQRCSRDRNCETETAKPRPGQNSETETLSNNPRLETCVSISIDLKICGLCQYFSKKCHHHFEIEFFQISGIFPTCFGRFSPADTADKRHVEIQTFCYAISLQY